MSFAPDAVMTVGQLPDRLAAHYLLERYGLSLHELAAGTALPGSFWGDSEAGIIQTSVYVRPDTPLHSLLHESCHVICMDTARRQTLHTDAGGTTDEEDAVCYLQILLAEYLPGFGKQRALLDMDRWGYTFRLGSAQRWFEEDADDAKEWLLNYGLINPTGIPTFRVRA